MKYNVKSNEQFRTNQIPNESNKENRGGNYSQTDYVLPCHLQIL